MSDSEHLLDNLLNEVSAGQETPEECLSQCRRTHPELVSSLELALALRNWSLDTGETAAAQERVWNSIESLLDEEVEAVEDTAPADAKRTRLVSQPGRKRPPRWLRVAVYAAILALVFWGSWTLSSASASALPGSPLYAIKRADENRQLQMAWSPQMRGDALAQIAMQRLIEARAAADQHNTRQALELMNECNDTTSQLIALVIDMRKNHQDDKSIANALAKTLNAEYEALAAAHSSGQDELAQALTAIVAGQQSTLSTSNISVPTLATPVPATPTAVATPEHTPHAAATPHPTHTPRATPGTKPTPNASTNGSGNSSAKGETGGRHETAQGASEGN